MKYPKRGSYKEAKAIQQKKIEREAKQRITFQGGMVMHGDIVHGLYDPCEMCKEARKAFDEAVINGEI